MIRHFEALDTPRLRLDPITRDVARAILVGTLAGLEPAEGWPHEDTADGLAMAIKHGQPAGWLVILDGRVIGDCGSHAPVDEAGRVEIGFGLAASYRGQGYGTEVVVAISDWLFAHTEVCTIRASTLQVNTASRRVLERAQFNQVGSKDGKAIYERDS